MSCRDRGDDHCCWIAGNVCDYLTEAPTGQRRWVCALYVELGSWNMVYASEEWLRDIAPTMNRVGYKCHESPGKGGKCHSCGLDG